MAVTSKHRTLAWPFLRSTTERILTGVAGGISERFGIRPIYIRAAFLAGGIGLIVYALAALLVPEAEEPAEPATTTSR